MSKRVCDREGAEDYNEPKVRANCGEKPHGTREARVKAEARPVDENARRQTNEQRSMQTAVQQTTITNPRFVRIEGEGMWKQGTIEVHGSVFSYCIKVYEEGSEFGIDGGKVSKLTLRTGGKEVASYDRGWDIKPTTTDAQLALELILHSENFGKPMR